MGKIFNAEKIREICGEAVKNLIEAPWESGEFYREYLAQTAFFVNHSTRLLALCAAYCNEEKQVFHQRFLSHAAEEKGHEKLVFMDLKNLGTDLRNFSESSATMSLYQPQYYWIQFKSPVAFFGYIFCLELIAEQAGPIVAKDVTEIYGARCTHFVRVHAEEDQDHIEKAIKMVEEINGIDEQYALENLIQSCENYNRIIEHCKISTIQKKKFAA